MPINFTKAAAFNTKQLVNNRLTMDMIAWLVYDFQDRAGIVRDGMAGDTTQTAISMKMGASLPATGLMCWPLRALPDGRIPKITSGHSSKNPSRPSHHGVDLLYPYAASDEAVYAAAHGGKPIPTIDPPGGDAGAAAASHGVKKWWVPDGTIAVACGNGRIETAGLIGTGHRVWLDLGDGTIAGYMHLSRLDVAVGDIVRAGDPIGVVGDSTAEGHDPRHLHFELYAGDATAGGVAGYPRGTFDPEPRLAKVPILPALG